MVFIRIHFTLHESSRNVTYRLKDNYVRFYLKYIEPLADGIEQGLFIHWYFTMRVLWAGFEKNVLLFIIFSKVKSVTI